MDFPGEQENASLHAILPGSTPNNCCGAASEICPLAHLVQTLQHHSWQQWRGRSANEPSHSYGADVSVSTVYQKKKKKGNSHSLLLLTSELKLHKCVSLEGFRLHSSFPNPTSHREHSGFCLGKVRLKMWDIYQGKGDQKILGSTDNK